MCKIKYLLLTLLAWSVNVLANDFVSPNCPLGCPTSQESNVLVFEPVYTLSLNPTTKLADWVAYSVDVANFGASNSTRNWENNPLLDSSAILEEADYKYAYSKAGYDMGHLAELGSFTGNRYWYTTNYLSNIVPQKSKLNRGVWLQLEDTTRDIVNYENPLFVIAGTIYVKDMGTLPSADEVMSIPSHIYKVIYDNEGNTATFVFPQDIESGANYCDCLVGLGGLDEYIPYAMPVRLRETTEMATRLGCHINQ